MNEEHTKVDFKTFGEENSEEHRVLQEANFGCPEKGEIGMKKKVDELYILMTGGSWAWKIIVGVIMFLGALVLLIKNIKGL